MTGLPALLLTLGSSDLDLAVEPEQQVAECRGAPKGCLGIMVVLGIIIKNAIPGLQQPPHGSNASYRRIHHEIDKCRDKLIDGGFSGDKSSVKALKDYVGCIILLLVLRTASRSR